MTCHVLDIGKTGMQVPGPADGPGAQSTGDCVGQGGPQHLPYLPLSSP